MQALTTIVLAFLVSTTAGQSSHDLADIELVLRQVGTPAIGAYAPLLTLAARQDQIGGIMGLSLNAPIENFPTYDWPPPSFGLEGEHYQELYQFGTCISLDRPNDTEVDATVFFRDGVLAGASILFPVAVNDQDKGHNMAMKILSNLECSYSKDLLKISNWDEEARLGRVGLEDADGNQLILDWDGNQRWLMLLVKAGWMGSKDIPATL